jgi:hypothetical protein
MESRLGLLFYEASEGGAGVLTQLAGDARILAQVARNALRLMHYNLPDDKPLSLELLLAAEQMTEEGLRICEAGCYQCLLSYYNQPEHEVINRQDPDALKFLVALANASFRPAVVTPPQPMASSGGDCQQWVQTIETLGLRSPDAYDVAIGDGLASAMGHYRAARVLVFCGEPPPAVRAYASDRGLSVIVFPVATDTWPSVFAAYEGVFGKSGGAR